MIATQFDGSNIPPASGTQAIAYLAPLDGLRGIAALAVLAFHVQYYPQIGADAVQQLPVISWLTQYGWMFVDLFFVISGYIFAHCYLGDGRLKPGTSIAGFAWARFARLWPLHFAMLVFAALVMHGMPGTTWENFALSALMLHSLIEGDVLNGPAWSVSVECLCYLLFIIAAQHGERTHLLLMAVAVPVGAALIFLPEAIEIGRGLLGYFWGQTIFRFRHILQRMPFFMPVALVATLPFLSGSEWGIIYATVFVWPALLLLALRTTFLGVAPLKWLGDRSYAIYLVHVPILIVSALIAIAYPSLASGSTPIFLIVTLAIIIAMANILCSNLERPAQRALLGLKPRIRDRFTGMTTGWRPTRS